MNLDYTFIRFWGYTIYEPVTILTNLLVTIYCMYCFFKMNTRGYYLATFWAWFFLLIGVSSFVGSLAHGAHFQLGYSFFNSVLFLMNAISLVAIFFCFKAANTYASIDKSPPKKRYTYLVILWIGILLGFTLVYNNFILIKIHAGIVLTYSLIVHYLTYRRQQKGSGWIVSGILIAFLSIIVHSLRISVSDWFNYKDIAHCIMLLSLIAIFKGSSYKVELNRPEELQPA
ncbi:MAG: hypothetical protein QM534_17040 [Sediminibacterium sp.]|nr:hypothetical protein [Sediminibacterium sp.]